MKKCTVCKEEKELDLYYRDKRAKDGRYSCCKSCMDKTNQLWASQNKEKVLELSRRAHERHREKEQEYAREYARKLRKENYQKYKENKDRWEKENPNKAREIRKKAVKKWTEKNKNKLKENAKEWRKKNPKKLYEYRKKARKLDKERYPQKYNSRRFFQMALRIGYIVRPDSCSRCQKECKPEGHHPDYNKPLDVIWLCKQCHVEEHSK